MNDRHWLAHKDTSKVGTSILGYTLDLLLFYTPFHQLASLTSQGRIGTTIARKYIIVVPAP
jgi:hypothetical protein